LIGQALGGLVFAAITLYLAKRVMDQHDAPDVPRDPWLRQSRLMQLFHHRR